MTGESQQIAATMDANNPTATVQKIAAVWVQLQQRWQSWTENAIRNYEYVIGNQLDKKTRQMLADRNRPALVFNLLNPLTIYIAGTLQGNQQGLRAIPVREGDETIAEVHTVLVNDWAMRRCEAYDEYAKASLDAAICGFGVVNDFMDFSQDPEGKWITRSEDPFRFKFDPDVRGVNQDRWRFYTFDGMYSADEILAIYGPHLSEEKKEAIREAAKKLEGQYSTAAKPIGWLDRVWNGAISFFGETPRRDSETGILFDDFIDSRNGIYRVIEWHDKRAVTRHFAYSPITRERREIRDYDKLDESARAQALADMPAAVIQQRTFEETWTTAVAPGLLPQDVLFEDRDRVQGAGWQHKVIIAHDFHPDITRVQSLTQSGLDPQDSFNQRRMTTLEALMDSVNPQVVAEEGAIDPKQLPAWEQNERGAIKFYTGSKEKPTRETPPPEAINGLARFAEEDAGILNRTVGISPNQQGFKETSDETATLFRNRVEQGLVMMQYFFGHITRAMKSTFTYCDRSLQEYLSIPRTVRILGEPVEGMQGIASVSPKLNAYWLRVNWPLVDGVLNDITQGEYDFQPDTTQLGQTARLMKFVEAVQFVKIMPKEYILWPELFKLWDSPIAKRMGAFAEQIMKLQHNQQLSTQSLEAQKAALELAQQAAGGPPPGPQPPNPQAQAASRLGQEGAVV